MIPHENTILSDELFTEQFVCHLEKCKGACCIEGDSGAPLEDDEIAIIEEVFEAVKPYLNEKGLKAIEEQGKWVRDFDYDLTTPCVDGNKECAYVVMEKGITQCAFEKAYNDGKTNFKKPISCHLYPIRISKFPDYEALNYDRWNICSPACGHGKDLGVSVFEFLKEPLIRKYGEEWYDAVSKKEI